MEIVDAHGRDLCSCPVFMSCLVGYFVNIFGCVHISDGAI